MALNVRKNAKPGTLTKLSLAKIKDMPNFKAKNIIRYYVAISSRIRENRIQLYLQSNIGKEFPKFAPAQFKTRAGQTISASENLRTITIDGQKFNNNESFNIFFISE